MKNRPLICSRDVVSIVAAVPSPSVEGRSAVGTPPLRLLVVILLTFVSAEPLRACPLCLSSRPLTISSQELVYAEHSVLALPTADGKSFHVVEAIKGEQPSDNLTADSVLRAHATKSGSTKPLLLIREDSWPRWVNFGPISADQATWLREIATMKRTTEMNDSEWCDHVAFFLPYLESPEPMVAEIAHAELANAPYSALRSLKPQLGIAAVREWLNDPKRTARQTLYISLLGIAGGQQDAERIEQHIDAAYERKDATMLMALLRADLELRGPSRVAWIENAYFARNSQRTLPEIEAALAALSEHGKVNAVVSRQRVIDAYSLFLHEHQMQAALLAKDLAEWGCWDFTPAFCALLRSGVRVDGQSRAAIIDYLLRDPKVEPAIVAELRRAN